MQTITTRFNKLKSIKRDQRGVSTVIAAMLGIVLIVIIVGNVFIINFQMNQLDWEKMQEKIAINYNLLEKELTLKNEGPITVHLVSIWVNNSTDHMRYGTDYFINSGEGILLPSSINLPESQYTIKIVTERGNIAVYSTS